MISELVIAGVFFLIPVSELLNAGVFCSIPVSELVIASVFLPIPVSELVIASVFLPIPVSELVNAGVFFPIPVSERGKTRVRPLFKNYFRIIPSLFFTLAIKSATLSRGVSNAMPPTLILPFSRKSML